MGQSFSLPSAHLHLYGKAEARRARKMGHITFIAPTLEQAQRNEASLRHSGHCSLSR